VRKKTPPRHPSAPSHAPSGIEGFDEITHGGLPRGRSTLIIGGPGSGKTVFSLQSLVNGAGLFGEPGIFVAFEENSKRIIANAATFGWNLPKLVRDKIFFLDAQPSPDLIQSGDFDLNGILAVLDAKVREMGARRIVFDSLDMLLNLLDAATRQREANRLNEWIMKKEITAILTGKVELDTENNTSQYQNSFMPFMVDAVVELNHRIVDGVSQRVLRLAKFRGSSFSENESPYVIGSRGLEVAEVSAFAKNAVKVTKERVSSGVERLDTMLGGGYYRGASILITGAPGTAKSTLSGAFTQAACARGEPTLFVSFDSAPDEIIRNLESVHIRLRRYQRNGKLLMVAARAGSLNSEIHYLRIKNLAQEHQARCLVIDPVSALGKQGNELTGQNVLERLLDWTKAAGLTLICTSLLGERAPETEGSSMRISTNVDTWIHLNYLVRSGERNRALTIVKSRGTGHSNQVRELVLSDQGITLTDVYTVGGEVFMGTLRWEKEEALLADKKIQAALAARKLTSLKLAEAELEVRAKAVQVELEATRQEKEFLAGSNRQTLTDSADRISQVRLLRGADRFSKGRRGRPGTKP
jgi:circadian clock protein KaiC